MGQNRELWNNLEWFEGAFDQSPCLWAWDFNVVKRTNEK